MRPAARPALRCSTHGQRVLLTGKHLPLEHPDLDAQHPVGGAGHLGGVVDVGTEGVQGHATLAGPLRPGDLGAVEAAAHLELQTQHPGSLGALDGHAHDAPEGHPLLQLLGDVLGQKEGVGIHPLHFDDVDPHLPVGVAEGLLDAGAQLLDAAALTAHEHARTGGLEFHFELVGLAGDQHVADAGGGVLLVNEGPDPIILLKEDGIGLAWGVPAGAVVLGDPQAQAGWMDLVSHRAVSSGVRRWALPQRC